jgi:hypothetical protein
MTIVSATIKEPVPEEIADGKYVPWLVSLDTTGRVIRADHLDYSCRKSYNTR